MVNNNYSILSLSEDDFEKISSYRLMYESSEYLQECFRSGDVAAVRHLLTEEQQNPEKSVLANEELWFGKAMTISQLTYISQYSIEAGVDVLAVERSNRHYAKRIMFCGSQRELLQISLEMSIAYTERINQYLMTERYGNCSRIVYLAVQYIRDHIFEDLQVETISASLAVSSSHLQRKIREETQHNLKDLIAAEKIRKAKLLLAHSDTSISEIATLLNYSSQSHFTATFRRETDMTPAAFRRESMLQKDDPK